MSKNQIDAPPRVESDPSSWEGSMTLVDGREPSRGPESQLGDYASKLDNKIGWMFF